MSAMHWEARRRQAVLDRRSRSKQVNEDPPQPIPENRSGLDLPTQLGEERRCVHCSSKPDDSVPYGGTRNGSRYNVSEDPPQPIPENRSGLDLPTQLGEERRCVHCSSKPDDSVPYGGTRNGSRYNSIQYSQQW